MKISETNKDEYLPLQGHLSQRGRAMLRVIECFAESLKII